MKHLIRERMRRIAEGTAEPIPTRAKTKAPAKKAPKKKAAAKKKATAEIVKPVGQLIVGADAVIKEAKRLAKSPAKKTAKKKAAKKK